MENWRRYTEAVDVYVHGYVKPLSSFHTISEWRVFVEEVLALQDEGHYVSGLRTKDLHPELSKLINQYYDFQLNTETNRYNLLNKRNILNHIEDFVNHRFWALENEFGDYFPDISKLKLAYFYSRGDLEPYVLVDDEFTTQVYGTTDNPKVLMHYTTEEGYDRIKNAIESGDAFDISAYTVAKRDFFRGESRKIMKFKGNVRAGFRSDVKSFSVSNGQKAVNLYRLGYPGEDKDNLCTDLENDCNGELRTSLWNEFIVTPIEILGVVER